MFSWIRRGSIFAFLAAGLGFSLKDDLPIAEPLTKKWLSNVDIWLSANTAHPTLFVFLSGLLIAFLFYLIVDFFLRIRRVRARGALEELRAEGAAIRIEAARIGTTLGVDRWVAKTNDWANRVELAIAKIDRADAKNFKTLGYPGEPEPHHVTFISEGHMQAYVWHDCRRRRLDERILQYSKNASGT